MNRTGIIIARMRAAAARAGTPGQLLIAAASGAAAGFFFWSLGADRLDISSLFLRNDVTEGIRLRLLLFIGTGSLLMLLLWILRFARPPLDPGAREPVRRTWTSLVALGIVAGFWPVLGIQAIEVYEPVPTLCLVVGMLAVLLLASLRLVAPAPLGGRAAADTQRWGLPVVLALAVGYAVFFGVYTVRKHLAFHSYALDLGWQNQAIYTLLHTGNPRVTGYLTILHFGNHFQPLYYLLAPLYAIRQEPATLLVLQAALLPTGAIPLFLIARRKLGSSWIALVVAVVYLLYPALHGMNTYDFHGLTLLVPILCFLLYFLDTGRMGWYWAFFVLALITREDAPITLSGVALYAWVALRKRRLGLAGLAACIVYFLMTVAVMRALGGYPNLQNYWELVLPEHQTYTGVALTLLTNPFFVFRHVFLDPEKLVYLLQIFTPVLFLPLCSGKKMILLAPGLAIILLSGHPPQYSIGYQYSAHVVAAVFFLAVCGIENIRARWPMVATGAIAVPLLAAGLAMNYEYGLILSKRFPGFLEPDERQRTAYSLFRRIPGDASVATISRLYPHLSSRTEIYLLDRMQDGTEFVLADLHPPPPASDTYELGYRTHAIDPWEVRRIILELLEGTEYGVVRYENGFVLLQRGTAAVRNRDVADAIRILQPEAQPGILPYFRDPAADVRTPRLSQSDLLVEFLDRYADGTVLIAGSGNVVAKLSYLGYLDLMKRGSRINTLRAGGSYLAVIRGNEVVFELLDNRRPVSASTASSEELQSALPGLAVFLRSTGGSAAGRSAAGASATGASIEVDGVECAVDQPGFHVVALDPHGFVTEQACFRTGE